MGQNSLCSCKQAAPFDAEEYVDMPYIGKEDVFQIKKCFDYLEPINGVVQTNDISNFKVQAPAYMGEIIHQLEKIDEAVTFDVFYKIMKPKILEMKNLPQGSVVLENNSTNVSCFLFPYTRKNRLNN